MSSLNFTSRWPSKRLGSIFVENKDKNTDLSNTFALQFSYGNIVAKPEWELSSSLEETYKGYTRVNSGDIVINGLNLNYDFVTQRVGLVRTSGIITSAYILLRKRINVSSGFYCYYFKAMDSQKIFNGMGTGIRLTLSYPLLKNLNVPVPPRAEQDQIVRFLDWKVSAINKLINVRKQRLEIIDELRLSVINKAIKQAMEQENSCQYMRLKTLLITHFSGCWGEDAYEGGNNHLCIRVADFDFDKLLVNPSANTMRHYTNKQFQTHHLLDKDLLLEKSGGGKKTSVGRVVRYRGCDTPSMFANFCECLRPNLKIVDSDYLAFLLKAFYHNRNMGELYTQTTGIQNINLRKYLNILLPVLPLTVQKQIITNIEEHFTINDRLVLVEKQEIDLLRELKNRLISDVVTGQIDVRNVEIPEYEYVDEEPESDSDDVDGDFDSEEISEET